MASRMMSGPGQITGTSHSRMTAKAAYWKKSFAGSWSGRSLNFGWLGSRNQGRLHQNSTPLPACPYHYHHRLQRFRSCLGRPPLR